MSKKLWSDDKTAEEVDKLIDIDALSKVKRFEEEMAGLKELAEEYSNEAQDALCRIENLEAKLAYSIPKERVESLINDYDSHIKTIKPGDDVEGKCIIQSLLELLSNQTKQDEVKCKICNDDGLYCNFCNTTVTQGKNDE